MPAKKLIKTTPKIRGKRLLLSPASIVANPWNPNQLNDFMENKLRKSVSAFGFSQEVIIRELKKGLYEIIDGEHRWGAAKDLKMEKIPCLNLGKLSDAEAKQMCEVFIHLHGTPDIVKEAALIKSLTDDHGIDISALAELLPYTKEELSSLNAAVDFDWNQYGKTPDETYAPAVRDSAFAEDGIAVVTGGVGNGERVVNDGRLSYTAIDLTQEQIDLLTKTTKLAGNGNQSDGLVAVCRFYNKMV